MIPQTFVLDPRLAADTLPLGTLELCELRLMDDARYPWVVLVPQRPALVEVLDLDEAARTGLWREVHKVAEALKAVSPCDKLNLATLGNVVPQLHIHVVARRRDDPAWPGPVWGHGQRQPLEPAAAGRISLDLRRELGLAAQ